MKLPSAEEYLKIIEEKAPGNLATLHHYRFLAQKDGKTLLYEKSRRTIVFKAEYNSKLYAIRFFLNDDEELFRRYYQVQKYLESRQLSWKVPFEFLSEEYYPALRMDWVEGFTFPEYLDSIISDPVLISQLQSKFLLLSSEIEKNSIAHGNLNMKHVRIEIRDQEPVIKLIDYDSMFIPSLKEKDSLTAGTSSFQHPMRLASDFSHAIDRFSIWVFLTGLEAFKADPTLWTNAAEHGYDKSKQILFNYRDLAIPQQSRAFQIIRSYKNEALNFYADKLTAFSTSKSLDTTEAPQIFSKDSSFAPRTSEITLPEKPASYKQIESIEVPQIEPEQKPATRFVAAPQPKIDIPEPKLNDPQPKIVLPKKKVEPEIKEEKKETVQLKVPDRPKKTFIQARRNRSGRLVLAIAFVSLLAFASVYFIKAQNNQPGKIQQESPYVAKKESVQPPQKSVKQELVFTTTNITQFLFGLYQSYNKRDLPAILSNYSDNLNQYYDAGPVVKNKLGDIIHDLFIKPAYYECRPDIRSLQSTVQGEICKLSIAVTETIKADRRSKKEDYPSKIEYTIDRSFKILSERNIE